MILNPVGFGNFSIMALWSGILEISS
jgi:hypothetical protein